MSGHLSGGISARLLRLQGDESGLCRPEAATAEIKRPQMVLEVDVQPHAASRVRVPGSEGDETGSYSLPPHAPGHQGVEDKRVAGPVPRDIHEPDEFRAVPRAYPAQTVPFHLHSPVVVMTLMAEALRVQGVELSISEGAAPLMRDHRTTVGTSVPQAHLISGAGLHAAGAVGSDRSTPAECLP